MAGPDRKEIVEEVKKQIWLAGPLICVSLLQFCLQLISLMFVGHLGELALSGASMATSFATVTGFTVLMGMASALETFCGQSYGAKQYHMLGIHMQRAMLILLLVSIPLAFIWAYTGPILKALGQDPTISDEAGLYANFMIPSLSAYGLLQCLVRFLQTQNNVFPMMLSSGITTLLHILVCWVLVFKSGLGNRGAALANSISYWINVLFLALYVKFSPSCANTWTGFSKEALQNILTFLRLSVPSAVMVCMELWSFEMMVLLSGLLPNPRLETSVLSICLNTSMTVWMIPVGLSGAVSTRVSNELGAGNPQAARLAVRVVLVVAITEGILVGSVLILTRNILGYAYSREKEVVRYVAIMMPIIATSNFMDGLQCVLSGSVRGCGWQKMGAFVNLGSYYLVGIPSAILLAFVFHIGGKGLWLGLICALFVQVLSLLTITTRTNWELEAKKATTGVYESMLPVDVADVAS
ncbi:protein DETOXIFICATION 16-like isoform X1 [Cornus florida]|uniref:protein DETOXIFICATION 16-like isoform X1 n=1 Tax=Cornus florida TaxID=4283 RepID=UPI00289D116F|nr:protein DETOXIFICATION 16-like isoform X1 [Cornus florida]XP_059630589.1 protein DETOXIFICATION 16-like isoform X1 [Cornus florida]XP_059630590.1 protein DETOXIFICATION 16-like isoform X1 [Cornus florida]XP_059630591.1 protein DETOXIFICATION 16-like isoform X1 [Cornus florida]